MQTERTPRTPLRLPVSVGRRLAAISADVSERGFCIEVMQPLRAGMLIDGYVLNGERELEFGGEVVWVEACDPMATPWSRVGVRFTWMSAALERLLVGATGTGPPIPLTKKKKRRT